MWSLSSSFLNSLHKTQLCSIPISMATLSASVFKIPTALNPKPHDLLRRHFNPNPKPSIKPTPTFNTSVNPPPTLTLITPKQPLINPTRSHHNPSTGYAAALLDAARSHRALESVSRDVRRLSAWLRAEAEVSGDALREVAKRGKLHKYLSRLVSLLVEKSGAAEMVSEVLTEFGRIHDDLLAAGGGSDRVVVLVSPGARMQIQEIARVAEKVQNISGAAEVTVRQLRTGTCFK